MGNFELYENARKRVNQRKKLFAHFIVFLVGSIFLIILNKIFKVWPNYDWFVWAILFWSFLLVLHFANVYLFNPFMGKEWQRAEIERLVQKQEKKISELEKSVLKEAKLKLESEQYAEELKKKENSTTNLPNQ